MRTTLLLLAWLMLAGTSEARTGSTRTLQSWPVPSIQSPAIGTTFAVGDKFKLIGSATDGAGNELPDSSLTWEIRHRSKKHSKYHHFLEPTQGNYIKIKRAPGPEDLKTAKESYLEILLTATDAAGLSTTTKLIVKPRKVDVHFNTNPPGLYLSLDGETFQTPVTITTWENHKFNVRAPSDQAMDGAKYKFAQWSDGGKLFHRYKVPAAEDTVVADYVSLPVPKIVSIEEGSTFAVGDGLKLVGSAANNQGNALPDSSLTWEVRLYDKEGDNYQTFLEPTNGNNIELHRLPEPEDFKAAEKSGHLKVLLTATDSTGLSSTESVIIEPRTVDLVFETYPTGFYVIADGHQLKTPATITTWEGYKVKLEAPSQRKKGINYEWESWSDGGTASHEYVTPAVTKGEPLAIKAVLREMKPEVAKANRSVAIGVSVGIVIAVLCVLILIAWKKKKGTSIRDLSDMSTVGKGSMKSADKKVQYSTDDSYGDIESRETADESGDEHSVAETSTASSDNSSIFFPTPINLSKYLLSANITEKGDTSIVTQSLTVSNDTKASGLTDINLKDDDEEEDEDRVDESRSHQSTQSEF